MIDEHGEPTASLEQSADNQGEAKPSQEPPIDEDVETRTVGESSAEEHVEGKPTEAEDVDKHVDSESRAEPAIHKDLNVQIDDRVRSESRKRTRRSFVVGAVASAAGYGIYLWIDRARQAGRLQVPLRRSLEFNRDVARTIFGERVLAPEYPVAQSVELRLNGNVGLEKQLDLASWRLQMVGVEDAAGRPRYVRDLTTYEYRYVGAVKQNQQAQDVKSAPGNGSVSKTGTRSGDKDSGPSAEATKQMSIADRFNAMNRQITHKRDRGDGEAGPSDSGLLDGTPGLLLTMDDLMKLPKVELVTEFKCIEGWSQVVHWGGVRLRDLMEAFPPAKVNGREPQYVYMETPNGNYYGGYDMSAARHPQSILVTEMAGKPLSQEHGAPLRLHMPIKYGYKQLKRIGLIAYMDQRPDDYWTKLGYDWYAGL